MTNRSKILWGLIRSLDLQEKRWLKRWSRVFNPNLDQEYLKLLDVTWEMKEFSEEKLQKEFGGSKSLSDLKSYLIGFIIEGLTQLKRSGKGIHGNIARTTTCFERGVWQKAWELAEVVIQDAIAREKYSEAMIMFQHKRKLLSNTFNPSEQLKQSKQLSQDYENIEPAYLELKEWEGKEIKYYLPIASKIFVNSPIENLTGYKKHLGVKPSISNRALLIYFKMALVIHVKSQSWTELESVSDSLLNVFHNATYLIDDYPDDYYSALKRNINFALLNGNKEKAISIFQYFKKDNFKASNRKKHIASKLISMFILSEVGERQYGKEAVEYLLENAHVIKHVISKNEYHLLTLFQVENLLLDQRFEEALNVIAKVLATESLSPRNEILSKILHLISLAELNDELGIEVVGRKYSSHSKKLPFFPVSFGIIEFIKSWAKQNYSSSRTHPEKKRLQALKFFEENQSNQAFSVFMNRTFDLKHWLETFNHNLD